jgi:hypothetical protein
VPDLYSANVGYPGMNLQIAATLDGALMVVGPRPVHGARRDAHAFAAFGLAEIPNRGRRDRPVLWASRC